MFIFDGGTCCAAVAKPTRVRQCGAAGQLASIGADPPPSPALSEDDA